MSDLNPYEESLAIELKAAQDRIAALTEQLAAACQDAKEAEAYAEELEEELRDTQDRANAFATKEYYTEMRAERAEAKLAKAVEGLKRICMQPDYRLPSPQEIARATLAELKGESHDPL